MPDFVREAGADAQDLVSILQRRWAVLAAEHEALEDRRLQIDRDLMRVKTEMTHMKGLLDIHGAAAVAGAPAPQAASRREESTADAVVHLIGEAAEPLHYREIERRMRAQGLYSAGGADPANTLLAKYFNDQRLYRTERGTYALREWQPNAASVGTKRIRRSRKGA